MAKVRENLEKTATRQKAASDDALLRRMRAALAGTRDVEEKKMFGGVGFMIGGKLCVSVNAGRQRIMCRINPADHDAAVERDGCRSVVMKGRPYRGYVHVDADAVRSKRGLDYWVDRALEHNRKVREALPKRKRR